MFSMLRNLHFKCFTFKLPAISSKLQNVALPKFLISTFQPWMKLTNCYAPQRSLQQQGVDSHGAQPGSQGIGITDGPPGNEETHILPVNGKSKGKSYTQTKTLGGDMGVSSQFRVPKHSTISYGRKFDTEKKNCKFGHQL